MSGHSSSKIKNRRIPFVTNPPSQADSGHQLMLHRSCPLTESPSPLTELHTPQLAKKYASDSTLPSAPEGMNVSLPTCVGTSTARVHTLARGAPRSPELQRAHQQRRSQLESEKSYTPLQHAQFESELQHHPDKSWTSNLLQSIQLGVTLGCEGPRGPMEARNLLSAHTHPTVVDNEIQRECQAGRLLGPFRERPLPSLKCSGVGVVPKKNGKWRMIHHLSAPPGSSVNDHVPKEPYSLQYSSVDDAVRLLCSVGKEAQMAKVDLKSGSSRSGNKTGSCSGYIGATNIMWTHVYLSG